MKHGEVTSVRLYNRWRLMKKLLIVTQNLEDGGGQNMILELVKNSDQTR